MDPKNEKPSHPSEVTLTSDQIEMVDRMAGIIASRIDLSEHVVRSFIWKCLRDWQEENGKLFVEVSEVPPPTRLEVFADVSERFRTQVGQFLSEDHLPTLDSALDACAETYRSEYQRR